jgi:4-amino-4-deoxy-L-arabinose transferase-like glycosyltransferase
MLAFTTFISVTYLILGLLMVSFYKRDFTPVTALVLTFVFLYNPQMILFKGEVVSDIPFTAMLLLNFLLYQKLKPGNLVQMILLSLVTGFMLSMRPAGITFVAAIVTEQVVLLYKRKVNFRDFTIHTGIFTTIPILIYFILNILIFKIPSGGSISDYLTYFSRGNSLHFIPENLLHHIKVLRFFLVPETVGFKGFSYFFGAVMMGFILLGFIKRIRNNPGIMDWFFIFYCVMLLIYPKNTTPFRLMIPLGFIFLFYAATGIKAIKFITEMTDWKKAIALGIVIMIVFMPGIVSIASTGDKTVEGPQQETSVEAFKYIHNAVPAEAIVVFAKPRALALYSGCQSMADPFTTDLAQINNQIIDVRATYLLVHRKITTKPMMQYVGVMQNHFSKQWGNNDFTLYKINHVNP